MLRQLCSKADTKQDNNAFQSKAHLALADRKSNTYNLTMEWPWLSPIFLILLLDETSKTDVQVAQLAFSTKNIHLDLGTQSFPGHGQDLSPHQKWRVYVNHFKRTNTFLVLKYRIINICHKKPRFLVLFNTSALSRKFLRKRTSVTLLEIIS